MPVTRYLQQKQVWSQMPMPANFFGVTARQLLVLVTVGGVAAYLLSNPDDTTSENLALDAFIRSQEQVGAQVGAVLGITLVRQVVAYPGVWYAGATSA